MDKNWMLYPFVVSHMAWKMPQHGTSWGVLVCDCVEGTCHGNEKKRHELDQTCAEVPF